MTFNRIVTAAWVIGIILVALSWFRVVPPQVGWVGTGITVVAVIISFVRRG